MYIQMYVLLMFDIGQFNTYSNALIKFTELEITDMI